MMIRRICDKSTYLFELLVLYETDEINYLCDTGGPYRLIDVGDRMQGEATIILEASGVSRA